MNLFDHFRGAVIQALGDLAAEGALPSGLDCARVAVDPPREEGHGDVTTNAAMVLAKPAGMKPRELAEKLTFLFYAMGYDSVSSNLLLSALC